VYVCDDGGFAWTDLGELLLPLREHGITEPDDFEGGGILRVDLDTGEVESLYEACDGRRLVGPNDIVFDASGGFWFTDHGKVRHRDEDRGGLYWAKADGSEIREVAWGLHAPNGVGLSPDGSVVYVAETHTGRLWAWDVAAPGEVTPAGPLAGGGRFVAGPGGYTMFDSLAVEADGSVCCATLGAGGITVIRPDDGSHAHMALPAGFEDGLTTNIAFGGDDLRTAALTLSGTGRVVLVDWPRPGLRLAYG
jgi:gluconolactonase